MLLRLLGVLLAVVLWSLTLSRQRPRYLPHPIHPDAAPLPSSGRPLVSIILPARNEARTIRRCLESLLAQDYAPFEVIAVDDCSEDETLLILDEIAARDGRVTVVRGRTPPAGQLGKAHAIVQGYAHAKGNWILFTDADTHHAPWLLSAVMTALTGSTASFATAFAAQRHAGIAYLVNLAVLVYLYLIVDFRRIEDPRSRQSLVNGQFVLFSREAYEALGTHAEIARYASTDVSLGYLAKLGGWKSLVLDGRAGLNTTMYQGAREALAGWSRSLVNGTWTANGRRRGSVALLAVVAVLLFLWVAPWVLFASAVVAGDTLASFLAAAAILAGSRLLWLQAASPFQAHNQRAAAVLGATLVMPLSCVVFAAMACAGIVRASIRGTVWKGRVVTVRRRLPRWRPVDPRPRSDP